MHIHTHKMHPHTDIHTHAYMHAHMHVYAQAYSTFTVHMPKSTLTERYQPLAKRACISHTHGHTYTHTHAHTHPSTHMHLPLAPHTHPHTHTVRSQPNRALCLSLQEVCVYIICGNVCVYRSVNYKYSATGPTGRVCVCFCGNVCVYVHTPHIPSSSAHLEV